MAIGPGGTFGTVVPERLGILAIVAATILLIVGMFFRRI